MSKHLSRVVDVLSHVSGLHPSLVNPRSKLVRDLGLDSLELIEVEYELSQLFDVDFDIARRDMSVQDMLDELAELTS